MILITNYLGIDIGTWRVLKTKNGNRFHKSTNK